MPLLEGEGLQPHQMTKQVVAGENLLFTTAAGTLEYPWLCGFE